MFDCEFATKFGRFYEILQWNLIKGRMKYFRVKKVLEFELKTTMWSCTKSLKSSSNLFGKQPLNVIKILMQFATLNLLLNCHKY